MDVSEYPMIKVVQVLILNIVHTAPKVSSSPSLVIVIKH